MASRQTFILLMDSIWMSPTIQEQLPLYKTNTECYKLGQQWFWTAGSGPDLGQYRTVAILFVQSISTPELSIRVRFNGTLPTCLNSTGCQLVAQQVHMWIHLMLLFLLFNNSMLSKSLIQHPIISVSMFGSLRYQLFHTLWFF